MKGGAELSHQIALELLRIKAVSFAASEPFVFASGMRSPMYCDNRLTLGYPPVREMIADAFEQQVRLLETMPDAVAGVATAGIAHAAWLAQRLNLPLAYVRPKAKGYGRNRQIEGRLESGQRTIVLEDLVTTGNSSLHAVTAVQEATGRVPESVMCIFTYDRPGVREKFTEKGVPLVAICDLGVLLHVAQAESLLSAEELSALRSFQQDPVAWSSRYVPSAP